MYEMAAFLTASFTSPEIVETNPQSLLWLLPLVLSIAIVYKAMKLPVISLGNFIKEIVMLLGSIAVFITVIAFALYAVARLITE